MYIHRLFQFYAQVCLLQRNSALRFLLLLRLLLLLRFANRGTWHHNGIPADVYIIAYFYSSKYINFSSFLFLFKLRKTHTSPSCALWLKLQKRKTSMTVYQSHHITCITLVIVIQKTSSTSCRFSNKSSSVLACFQKITTLSLTKSSFRCSQLMCQPPLPTHSS